MGARVEVSGRGAQVARVARMAALGGLVAMLAACGSGKWFSRESRTKPGDPGYEAPAALDAGPKRQSTLWDLFGNKDDPNTKIEVNKYLWQAAQEVLNFLPVQSVDPFSGIIVYGYGTPPGGGTAYRATVFVQDPALDARSLKVSLVGRGGGPVDADTQRAVEDAILTRARQLRIRDTKL